MVMERILGVMEENMKVNTIWTRNMVTVYITGLMEGDMKATGKMESSMEKENIYCQLESRKSECGKTVRE